MDSQKAIELIKNILPKKVSYADLVGAYNCYGDNYVYEEPESYALELAITALEKQTPKKPIVQETDEKTHYKCECGSMHLTIYKRDGLHIGHEAKFCEWCGQAIDWSNPIE